MAEEQVSVRLLVDRKKNRVLFAEAGKDFVDALLSFLTLPLGTIARIVGKDSNLKPVRVGSLSSLYESVVNLEEKQFWNEACKEMLIKPRNATQFHHTPKLNINDSEPQEFFLCEDPECNRWKSSILLSSFKNTKCRCGRMMNRPILYNNSRKIDEGYVNELGTFTLSDDLKVKPSNLLSSIVLLNNPGSEDVDSVEEMTVKIHQKEIVDILKCSLLSKTPLTDVFLQKKEVQEDFEPDDLFPFRFEIGMVPLPVPLPAQAEDSKRMKVKVVVLKNSKHKVLFAEAEEDFANFLLSVLTLPLGAILNLLEGNSGCISFDNLFKSLVDLHETRHLRSEVIKDMLVKPKIAPQFKLQNLILPIDEDSDLSYKIDGFSTVTMLDPKSSSVSTSSAGGFAKGPSMFMVTDNLVVTPISSISVSLFLNKCRIPLHDLEERVISIGVEEGLSIIKASLISSSALTVGLGPFLERGMVGEEMKTEC